MPEKKKKSAPATKSETEPKAKTPKKPKFYRTGEKCPESGLWQHFCREKNEDARIPLSKSETFPPCRTCGSVRWKLTMSANSEPQK